MIFSWKQLASTFCVICFAVGMLFHAVFSFGDGLLHIYFLNIGQGDAILIRTATGETILIDGGPDEVVLERLSEVLPFFERRIDVMVLSHPHADHMNGLIPVLERYDVGTALVSGVSYGSASHDRFLELLSDYDVDVRFVDGSSDFRLGNVVLDMLFPLRSMVGDRIDNLNNSSVVFRLLYGEEVFYFSGDLEEEGEEMLIESGLNLSADVLKVGHHGSRTSTTREFLELVEPELAVISCGVENQFGHPHPETVTKLQQNGVRIYRTDLDGTVELRSDGRVTSAY